MASASITTRATRAGKKRYAVRYRLGGRSYPVRNAGVFGTRKEADDRLLIVKAELALGRNPEILLGRLATAEVRREVFSDVAERYVRSRIDVGEQTRTNMESHLKTINATFGSRIPAAITHDEVQDWVATSSLKATTVKKYVGTLRAVLSLAGVDPDPTVGLRLPKVETEDVDPPNRREAEAIIRHTPNRWRLAVRYLEGTGLRVGELCHLQWSDIDQAGSRLRVARGKTRASRRWVPIPVDLLAELLETPIDDQVGHVFKGSNGDIIAGAMRKACRNAGVANYSPHDMRHRYISLLVAQGVPIAQVSAQVGHTSKVMTLDTYSHVLID